LIWRNDSQANEGGVSGSISSSSLSKAVSRLRPLIERIWQRFPLPVANWIGPKLRRYITL
jgi:hypothetical protein